MLPVLCYHKVGPSGREGRFLNVEPRRLESHVRFFARRGRRFVAARDLAGLWPLRAVCLTFDDAYASTLEHGVSVLSRHGVTASFFAVARFVGATSSWDADRARPLATWDRLRDAQRAGFEIGNHSASHPRFADLDEAACAHEVAEAHRTLLENGLVPGSFCYPYGSRGPAAERALRNGPYPVALILGKRPARPADDPLAIPRVVVGYSDGLPKLLYKLHVRPLLGGTVPVPSAKLRG
ncbi:MAG: polysaccharide deacetylase family protein [Fimbriimonadaceae bacterium]|nr:polysaccharide deacetylase family protein [Fimbriimonadaceae bacterium]